MLKEVVDVRTFVKDPYFLGNSCSNIYPKLLEDLEEMFSGNYREVVLTGGLGWGKSYLSSIGVCRILYELSCMDSPQENLKLLSGSNISILCLSVNESQAMRFVFDSIAAKISASPYFKEHFPFSQTKKELRFPRNIWVAARASTDSSALGLNVFGLTLDEASFWRGGKVESIYDSILCSMKARFARNQQLPGMTFVVSSKKAADDFISKKAIEGRIDSTIFVRDYSFWEPQPEGRVSKEKFCVLVGNGTVPSRILSSSEVEEARDSLPEGASLIEVPEDFRKDFEADLMRSIRDLAGRVIGKEAEIRAA